MRGDRRTRSDASFVRSWLSCGTYDEVNRIPGDVRVLRGARKIPKSGVKGERSAKRKGAEGK